MPLKKLFHYFEEVSFTFGNAIIIWNLVTCCIHNIVYFVAGSSVDVA